MVSEGFLESEEGMGRLGGFVSEEGSKSNSIQRVKLMRYFKKEIGNDTFLRIIVAVIKMSYYIDTYGDY